MPYYTILYYAILYYTKLYYTIPYCTILYHTKPYYAILYFPRLYYTILQHPCFTIPYYTILDHAIPYYNILYHIILHCAVCTTVLHVICRVYLACSSSPLPIGYDNPFPRMGVVLVVGEGMWMLILVLNLICDVYFFLPFGFVVYGMASHGDGDMNDLPSQLGTWIFIAL